jgi:hypothetical protein
MRHTLLAIAVAGVLAGASDALLSRTLSPAPIDPGLVALESVIEVASPAPPGSGQPQLATARDGRVVLSWMDVVGERRHRFRYAERAGPGWTEPGTIVEGDNFFVNWADVPSVWPLSDGRLAAHWLFRAGTGTYAYHVGVKVSDPSRRTWSDVIIPHRDQTLTEHGFVSMFDWPAGGLGLIWLDGRQMAGRSTGHGENADHGEMSLRATNLTGDTLGTDTLIDSRTCECCPTAAARTDRGVVIAWRDRSATEVRDIYLARFENGAWTKPYPAPADNWQISGCPVNSPALSAQGRDVVLAWFTAEGNDPRVMTAFSTDGGRTFGKPVRADDGVALGRIDVELLPDRSALVSWIEYNDGKSELRVRRLAGDGRRGPSMRITGMSQERSSGYPRMTRSGQTMLFAWTATGKPAQVRVASGRLKVQGSIYQMPGTSR